MYTYLEAMSSKGGLNSKEFMQTLLCLISVFVSVRLWSHNRRKWQKTSELIEAFPGPVKVGILGCVLDMYYLALDPARDLLDFFHRMAADHGSIYRYWMFNVPKICIADPDLAIKMYSNDCLQGKSTEVTVAARGIGGEGLLALQGDIHSHRRKQWTPCFTRKQVENSVKFFREQAIKLCGDLEQYAYNGKVFNFLQMSVGCTFRAICYSAFGKEYMEKLPESVGWDHMHDLHMVSLNMTAKIFRPWIPNNFVYFNFTREGHETMKSIRRGNQLTRQALYERKKHKQNQLEKLEAKGEKAPTSEDFECFLDHMIELMNAGQLTEKEVVNELNVFIAAGYDTSGLTICYVLYFLSLHPEHQDKIVEELREVIPSEFWPDKTATSMSKDQYQIMPIDTKKMKHMELCIKETLRLYPVLPISPRKSSKDIHLTDGRVIPSGVDVFVLLDLIHRSPKYFPEPDKFIPERHMQPNPAFMPFTLGKRNCIGQVYAMYEMKVILAYLLMNYKWDTTEKDGFKPIYQTLLVPETGMHFKITKREV